jgi:hypothetical protein
MEQRSVERRRGRRIRLQAPLVMRHAGTNQRGAASREELTQNLSLAGAYFETPDTNSYTLNDSFIASAAVPESHRREFPFTRLAGSARVVRVTALPPSAAGESARYGVALEFGDDLIALSATPVRG